MPFFRFLIAPQYEDSEWASPSSENQFTMTDDDGTNWLYIPLSSDSEAEAIMAASPAYVKVEKTDFTLEIDWQAQWAAHSPHYNGKRLQVDLSEYYEGLKNPKIVELIPGPGFGDLSHPTTRLTLSMMAPYVIGKNVIDIGCGSGILSLAAIGYGAKSACGIDIDPDAITHAKDNAILNDMGSSVTFILPATFVFEATHDVVMVMNMIRSQQAEAWNSLPQLHKIPAELFTSGVLKSEREAYIHECQNRGWILIDERSEEDWLGFHWKVED